ncbi:MAG: hypothetical protein IPH31_07310 [Lewinellaceae bacterium]|nr:hypothetical protein [Lewinellaceae bacterium]
MAILKRSTRSAFFLLSFFSSLAFFKADAQTTLTFQPAAPGIDSTQIEAFLEGIPAGMAKLVGVWGDQNFIADSAAVDASGHLVLRRKKVFLHQAFTLFCCRE